MRCPACEYENPEDHRFCGGCGTPLETSGHGAPERAPASYTPGHLAERVLTSRSAIEGELKQLTVLFADVKGSTELSRQVGPEEWHAILDRFFRILSGGVHRFEGTVNQYTGDGIMALFGAPIAHEDHAQRACYTALHLRDELRVYADRLRLERGVDFATRIGLNSGEVVVGKIGDDLRMDYTAQGQVVHLAERMEQLAGAGRVCLSQATADRVSGYFRLRDLGATDVKGADQPLHVYELEGPGPFQSRFDVSRARGLSKFVGRDREMAQLEAALERAREGAGPQIVGIVAEAGTGKSRLSYQFVERCRAQGIPVDTASCPPHGRNIPLALHMAMVRSTFDVTERDDDETARNKVAGQMVRLDPAMGEDVPFMLDFLGIAEPEARPLQMDAETRQRRFFQVAERIVRARLGSGIRVALLETVPENEETRGLGIAASIGFLIASILEASDVEGRERAFQRGRRLALQAGDVRAVARLTDAFGAGEVLMGSQPELGLERIGEALALARDAGDTGLCVSLHQRLGWGQHMFGRYRESLATTEAGIALSEEDAGAGADVLGYSPYLWMLAQRAQSLQTLGGLDEAEREAERAERLSLERDDPICRVYAVSVLARNAVALGWAPLARERALRALELSEGVGITVYRTIALMSLVRAAMLCGEWSTAVDAYDRAAESGAFRVRGQSPAISAEARMHLGDPAPARALLDRPLEQAVGLGEQWTAVEDLLSRARVQMALDGAGASERVEATLAFATEIAERGGLRAHLPALRVERAKLARLGGDEDGWGRELREAQRLFGEVGAAGHVERIARELGSAG